MAIFRFFQDGGRPPSWLCNACIGNTHEGHFVVFIIVQYLAGIDAVVLIICTFFDFESLPEMGSNMKKNPKMHILARVRVV